MDRHNDNHAAAWVRPEIQSLSAYHVPDYSGMVKLDAMENPYNWPAALRQEWAALLAETDVNRYPDPVAASLKMQLRQAMGITDDMGLVLGNGSDEIIQIIAMALAGNNRVVMSVEPSFVMYRMISVFSGMRYVGVPLEDDFSLNLQALLEAMDQHQPAVIFLAHPNNPTGNLFDEDKLEKIIQVAPGLVVIDEAYAPFTDTSFIDRLGRYPNLVVMRTVSKMGLAGLRLGLLAGPRDWLDEFEKVRLPYNINVLTQKSAEFALKHQQLFDQQALEIRQQRARMLAELSKLGAMQVYPSEANFILIRLGEGEADRVFEGLKAANILIKRLHGGQPALNECLRITIGTPAENDLLLAALGKLL